MFPPNDIIKRVTHVIKIHNERATFVFIHRNPPFVESANSIQYDCVATWSWLCTFNNQTEM